jgi:uncharacterized protein YprB with RNaseH-like and TPR domain
VAKILSFDIETCGVNALKSDLGFVIIFGYKWAHEKQAHVLTISQEALRNFDDRQLLKQASKIFSEADLVIGHYASVFDRRFIQGRLLINNLPPIPQTKMRDTCMIARSVANFSSNRLKHLAKILTLRHQKLENGWPQAWFDVMRGNMRALREMADYCKGDVLAVEELYLRLRPFDNAHPRMVADRAKCGACGGEVEYRGFSYANNNRYRRYVCKRCQRWARETKIYRGDN